MWSWPPAALANRCTDQRRSEAGRLCNPRTVIVVQKRNCSLILGGLSNLIYCLPSLIGFICFEVGHGSIAPNLLDRDFKAD